MPPPEPVPPAPPGPGLRRRPAPAAGWARQFLAVAAIGVVAAILVLRWTERERSIAAAGTTPAIPAPLPPRPVPAPEPPPPPLPSELGAALALAAEGRLREAQRRLLAFQAGPAADGLLPDHRETLTATLDRLAGDPALAAALDFERGFAEADVPRLRRALGALSREETIALRRDPQTSRHIDDARRLTAEVDAVERLLDSDRLGALRLAQDFARRHPRFAAALGFEERAARAIDSTAGRLIAAHRLEEARTLLLKLRSLRGEAAPETASVDARLASIEAVFRRQSDLEAAVREIEALGRERPYQALERLAAMERTPENRRRLAQVKSTLELLVDDLDRESPTVEILAADGRSLDQVRVRRREDLVLRVRASDDHEVVLVRLFWRWFDRNGEGGIVEAELRPVAAAGDAAAADRTHEATIRPAEHGGRSLQVWAEASDRGGRTVRSADPPDRINRARRGFLQRLRRRQ